MDGAYVQVPVVENDTSQARCSCSTARDCIALDPPDSIQFGRCPFRDGIEEALYDTSSSTQKGYSLLAALVVVCALQH